MEWSNNLEIGHSTVDKQHKELFRKIDDLVIAGKNLKSDPTSFSIALTLLMEYCLMHFSEEENIQLRSKYPLYLEHKEQHTNFLSVLKDFEYQFEENGASEELANNVEKVAIDWLIVHIAKMDQTIASHIATQSRS